jgi:hypothetical protein
VVKIVVKPTAFITENIVDILLDFLDLLDLLRFRMEGKRLFENS